MEYLTKVIIDGQEIGEGGDVGAPSISSMKLTNNASLTSIDIGATAADCLTFTLNNPPKASFDGDKVELFISRIDSDEETTKERIENEVGTEASDEGIDEDDIEGVDDDEDGEDLTEDELAELEEYDEELVEIQTVILEGEDETGPEETTAEEEEPEWIPFGVYYVYQQANSDNSVTLTCYDAFSLMNGIYALGSATWAEHWTQLTSQLQAVGIELDAYEFERGTDVITIKSGSTIREALGILCGYAGGYATCDTDGSVGISFYSYADKILIESDLISIRDTSAGEALIDGVICYDDRGYSIESTSGSATISMTNYAVTQEVLDEVIAPLYKGIRFGGAVAIVDWDDELRAGEFIRVMSEDEYAAYLELDNSTEDTRAQKNALGRVLLISNQVITFGSNVTAVINSTAESESEKAKYTYPPMLKKIIEAGQTATNYITEDESGALVIRREGDDYNVRIDADSVEVRKGDEVLASFGAGVSLGSYGNNIRIDTTPMSGGINMDISGYNAIFFGIRGVGNDADDDVIIAGRRGAMLELGVGCSAAQGGAVAMGEDAVASKSYSYAHGWGTIADNRAMTAIGKHNTEDSGAAFVIGNGKDAEHKSDALEVTWGGALLTAGNIIPNFESSKLNGTAWGIGSTGVKSRTTSVSVGTSYVSVLSITCGEDMPPGRYLVIGRLRSEAAVSSDCNFAINLSKTNALEAQHATNRGVSGTYCGFETSNVFDVSGSEKVYLNARCTNSQKVGTMTQIRFIKLR